MLFLGYFVRKNYPNWFGPSLELITDIYDFGDIEEGSNAQYYIRFRNDKDPDQFVMNADYLLLNYANR